MNYYATSELAEIWGISRRRVTTLCREGRLEGAILKGETWLIPDDVEKPEDLRRKEIRNSCMHSVKCDEMHI